MSSVKPRFPDPDEVHVAMLGDMLLHRMRVGYDPDDWDGLRVSQQRVIGAVPPERISITDLAARVRMTKQGCGQFVAQLVETGHLQVDTSPEDQRLRLVGRTDAGQRLIERLIDFMATFEKEWAAEVGASRYGVFREVLEELTLGHLWGGDTD